MTNKKRGRGIDKQKRKLRQYPATIKILISVPQEVADWLKAEKRPSKRVIDLVSKELLQSVMSRER